MPFRSVHFCRRWQFYNAHVIPARRRRRIAFCTNVVCDSLMGSVWTHGVVKNAYSLSQYSSSPVLKYPSELFQCFTVLSAFIVVPTGRKSTNNTPFGPHVACRLSNFRFPARELHHPLTLLSGLHTQ